MAAEAIAAGALRSLSNIATSLAYGQFQLFSGTNQEIKNLEDRLSMIKSFLSDAERKLVEAERKQQRGEEAVKLWIQRLQEAAYNAEDLLDELSTEALRRRQRLEGAGRLAWIREVTYFFLSCFNSSTPNPVLFRYRVALGVKKVRERFDNIVKEGSDLGLQKPTSMHSPLDGPKKQRETSSCLSEHDVVGRMHEKASLIRMLLLPLESDVAVSESDRRNYSVVSIAGMGGLGKTTLAQLAYNDSEVDNHFNLKIWVHVSADLDMKVLLSDIIESACNKKPKLTTLDTLQTELKKILKGKRFLIVLDDVWDQQCLWQNLRVPLNSDQPGSRVIITTRNQHAEISSMPTTPINLSPLSFDDCWSIFQWYAFNNCRLDFQMDALVRQMKLELIGKEIVRKARGVPLAAKALGGLAGSVELEEHRWRTILESEIARLPEDSVDIIPVLRLSYQHLPPELKQCFVYCAIFPKGYMFDKSILVRIWVALGLIEGRGEERLEDVGSDYFDKLLHMSFFEFSKGDRYMMHDFMHDLAQSISGGEYHRLDGDNWNAVTGKVRHLSVSNVNSQTLKHLQRFPRLRSLLFLSRDEPVFVDHLHSLFKRLKTLRVLDLGCIINPSDAGCSVFCQLLPCYLCGVHSRGLPDSICSLIHLRYLCLSISNLSRLPDSLGALYNLQDLRLGDCRNLHRLARAVTNLTNLRHLEVNDDVGDEVYQIADIGKLTHLQELKKFCVGREIGRKIGELQLLNNLQGSLSILNLENVTSRKEAMEAKLDDKKDIGVLELEWAGRRLDLKDSKIDEEVLEGLKPQVFLKGLVIRNYGGMRSPEWLQNLSLTLLESVILHGCRMWKVMPPFGQLQYLEVLILKEMDGGRQFQFYDDGSYKGQLFPSLRKLEIWSRTELSEFPTLPSSLMELSIDTQGFKADMSRMSSSLQFTRTLKISQTRDLTLQWEVLFQNHLRALKELNISNCARLVSLPIENFESLSSLRKLMIKGCRNLKQLPPLPPELHMLELSEVGLRELPLLPPALKYMSIDKVGLRVLPEFWVYDENRSSSIPSSLSSSSSSSSLVSSPSLLRLEISECSNITSLCEGMLQQPLTALKEVFICGCQSLESLPDLQGLVSLEKLTIVQCCKLVTLSRATLPISLKRFEIEDCPLLLRRYKEEGCTYRLQISCPPRKKFARVMKPESYDKYAIHQREPQPRRIQVRNRMWGEIWRLW